MVLKMDLAIGMSPLIPISVMAAANVEVCPTHALKAAENEYDPLVEEQFARVVMEKRKEIRYMCALCRLGFGAESPPSD
jgi:hypothetical protein